MALINKYYKMAKMEVDIALEAVELSQAAVPISENDNVNPTETLHQNSFHNIEYNNVRSDSDDYSGSDNFSDFDGSNLFDFDLPESNLNCLKPVNQNKIDSLTPHTLREWAIKHQINHTALSDLLKLIVPEHKEFPRDARTLLQTPRKNQTAQPRSLFSLWAGKCST